MHASNLRKMAAAILMSAFAAGALAKLPAPSEEEKAKVEASKQKAAQDAATEKVLLEKAQDRVAAQYIQQQKSRGVAVTPTPTATAPTAEVPSAALNSRPTEKAGAYNEQVSPQTAGGATQGDKTHSGAATPQPKDPVQKAQ